MDTDARIAASKLPDLSETWVRREAPTIVLTPMPPVWPFMVALWGGCGILGCIVWLA